MIEPHALACSGLGFSQLSCTVLVFATFLPMSNNTENTLYKRGISIKQFDDKFLNMCYISATFND